MNFEDGMVQAMRSTEHYEEPAPEKPKRNIISQNVQGIRDVLDAEAQQRANKRRTAQLVGVPEQRVFRGHLPE